MKVTVFGSGYVGLVSGACLANLGHEVMCVDIDAQKIEKLKRGEIPFYEPGLGDLVVGNIKRNRLHFTTNAEEGVHFGEIILNCVGTPGKSDGSANLDYVFEVAKSVAKYANGYKVLVNKSTVPPGTARKADKLIHELNPSADVDLVSNPEFLKEGAAVHDFNHPDRIVIGIKEGNTRAGKLMVEMYAGLLRTYIEVIVVNWETSELSKYASNAFLATKVSFINEMANICDRIGADVKNVARIMGLDYRIGPKFLNAGVGYGGSCFPKDVKALVHFAHEAGYNASIVDTVDKFNEKQKLVMLDKVKTAFKNSLKGKVFGFWGLSFKPKTSDMRDAPSIMMVNELLKNGAAVRAYDPEAVEEAKKIFGKTVTFCQSPEETAAGADAIILATEWDEFRGLDLPAIKKTMKSNFFFDGRNVYEPKHVREAGFEYYGMGQP